MLYKDPTKAILKALFETLEPVGLPVYSFVPNDTSNPYIFIGDIQLNENQTACFIVSGTFTVELYTGSNSWVNSLDVPLTWAQDIKTALKQDKGSVLDVNPTHTMIYMRMDNDSGLQQYSNIERLFVDTIQYEFELQQNTGYVYRVEQAGGIVDNPECVPWEYR